MKTSASLIVTQIRCISVRHETMSVIVREISAEMVKAKEAREDFELRDLRRTDETMLAGLKVPSDVRAQLLSHGLGGVQSANHSDWMRIPICPILASIRSPRPYATYGQGY